MLRSYLCISPRLSPAGGRLVIPIGPAEQQRLTVIVRDGDRFAESTHHGCIFVPLVGVEGWPE
jgi:protein-L-isoaspartate(D-aspartate) O-methyltransferase